MCATKLREKRESEASLPPDAFPIVEEVRMLWTRDKYTGWSGMEAYRSYFAQLGDREKSERFQALRLAAHIWIIS